MDPASEQYASRILDLDAVDTDERHVRAVVQRVARASSSPGGSIGAGSLHPARRRGGRRPGRRRAGWPGRSRTCGSSRTTTAGSTARSLDTGGAALVVSQFTLLADTAKGNRPSFSAAAGPETAEPLYEQFAAELRALGIAVETGVFGAQMAVELVNDGPVTIVLE